MKTLVGVDLEDTYRAALNLCIRLDFPGQEWMFAHAVAPLPTYAPGLAPIAIPMSDAIDSLRKTGREALTKARESVSEAKVVDLLLDGSAAATLMRVADEQHADLIVTGSGQPRRGLLWMIGSVSRALSYGAKQSLLVTKGTAAGAGPVHAIFATDHSEYARCAEERLIEWAPKGLRRIDVVTAYDVTEAAIDLLKQGTEVNLDFENWVYSNALKHGEASAKRLKAIAPETEVRVERGSANDVIANAMSTSGADLLIVGAQGHGFIERLLVGSVSLHQLVAEPYPVLLIRLP